MKGGIVKPVFLIATLLATFAFSGTAFASTSASAVHNSVSVLCEVIYGRGDVRVDCTFTNISPKARICAITVKTDHSGRKVSESNVINLKGKATDYKWGGLGAARPTGVEIIKLKCTGP